MCRFEGTAVYYQAGLISRRFPGNTEEKHKTYQLCHLDETWTGSFFHGATAPRGQGPPHYRDFTITLRHTTLGRTLLDEWSVRRRNLYLTKHNTHKRQTSMLPARFEPTIPASEQPQTHAIWTWYLPKKCRSIIILPRYMFVCLLVIWSVCYWLMLYKRGPLIFQKSGSHFKILGARRVPRTNCCRRTHKC